MLNSHSSRVPLTRILRQKEVKPMVKSDLVNTTSNILMMKKEVNIHMGDQPRSLCRRTDLYRSLSNLTNRHGDFIVFYYLKCVLLDNDDINRKLRQTLKGGDPKNDKKITRGLTKVVASKKRPIC